MKRSLDLCDLLMLQFYVNPSLIYETNSGYIGLSEEEIRNRHTNVTKLEGIHENETLLEIRLSDGTLTCVMNANNICLKSYLFTD